MGSTGCPNGGPGVWERCKRFLPMRLALQPNQTAFSAIGRPFQILHMHSRLAAGAPLLSGAGGSLPNWRKRQVSAPLFPYLTCQVSLVVWLSWGLGWVGAGMGGVTLLGADSLLQLTLSHPPVALGVRAAVCWVSRWGSGAHGGMMGFLSCVSHQSQTKLQWYPALDGTISWHPLPCPPG